jgi:alanine racemase
MARSEITIDLGALRRNAALLIEAAAPAELWAVVKADAYGHGASDCARAALAAGARALCVATVGEGTALRTDFPAARILLLSPLPRDEQPLAREARLEVALTSPQVPDGLPVHLKVDTGMGRFGMSAEEAGQVDPERVVGVMSHLATADSPDGAFVRAQLEAFAEVASRFPAAVKHIANSAAALALPEARFDAVRCGVALYGLSPFGRDPAEDGLEPALAWRSAVAQAKTLSTGASTGYGRRFVAEEPTRIGLVPVGYGDGFRRALSGTEVVVGSTRRRVLGTVSMDSFAVELGDETEGTPVTLIGDGLLVEEHARHAGTINYELTTAIVTNPRRAARRTLGG